MLKLLRKVLNLLQSKQLQLHSRHWPATFAMSSHSCIMTRQRSTYTGREATYSFASFTNVLV